MVIVVLRCGPRPDLRAQASCAVLTHILSGEDHFGDMAFKVAGTEKGITSLHKEIKV